jgi:hypothetical protein
VNDARGIITLAEAEIEIEDKRCFQSKEALCERERKKNLHAAPVNVLVLL